MPNNIVEKKSPQNTALIRDVIKSFPAEHRDAQIIARQALFKSSKADSASADMRKSFLEDANLGLLENNDAFIFYPVLTTDECSTIIQSAEEIGLSHWDETREKSLSIRDCKTIECELPEIADFIWNRVRGAFEGYLFDTEKLEHELHHSMSGKWRAVGLNPHLLISRYDPGGHFSPHIDGSCVVDINKRSFYSVIIYLNTVEKGGGTSFFSRDLTQCQINQKRRTGEFQNTDGVIYTQEAVGGAMLIFDHNLLHEGVKVEQGSTKYIIRTDVMFERCPRIFESEADQKALQMIESAKHLECDGKPEEALKILMKVRHVSREVARMYSLD